MQIGDRGIKKLCPDAIGWFELCNLMNLLSSVLFLEILTIVSTFRYRLLTISIFSNICRLYLPVPRSQRIWQFGVSSGDDQVVNLASSSNHCPHVRYFRATPVLWRASSCVCSGPYSDIHFLTFACWLLSILQRSKVLLQTS